jgi:hypothetical protein
MVWTILKWVFWGFILIVVVLWFVSGGPSKVVTAASNLINPFGGGGTNTFALPWQMPMTRGPDISQLAAQYDASVPSTDSQSGSVSSGKQNPDMGVPSPYSGRIRLSLGGALESNPNAEYLTIANDGMARIDLSGWSLQSALTGVRAYLPRGASLFRLGALIAQDDIVLESGGSAIVTTGFSPVGTSFRENMCSGYLSELQSYAPPLNQDCPSPSDTLDETGAGLRILGDSCYNFVATLSACHFPSTVPANLNTSCRLFVANTFSYNGCVDTYKDDPNFPRQEWRIYLGSPHELWRNTHDVIRLLDTEGRTVALVNY